MSNQRNRPLLYGATVLFWFSIYVHMPYLTPYLSALGLSAAAVGTVVGAYGFMQILLRCPLGVYCDRRGRCKPFILAGCLLAALAGLLRVLFPNSVGFLLANFLGGGGAAMWICFIVFASSLYGDEERQRSSGLVVMLNNLGILLGYLAGAAAYDRFGMAFLCRCSVAGGLAAAALASGLREDASGRALPERAEILAVYRDRNLISYAVLALVLQGIQASTANSFTSQVAASLGASGWQIGLCSVIYILCAVLSAQFGGTAAAARIPARLVIPVGLLLAVAYCLLVPRAGSVEVLYLAQILIGTACGFGFSAVMAEAMRCVSPRVRTTGMGLFQATLACGLTFCPLLMGAVKGRSGMGAAYGALAALALAGLCFSLYLSRPRAQP
jgi:predicted MFS family arabinose efflux permease